MSPKFGAGSPLSYSPGGNENELKLKSIKWKQTWQLHAMMLPGMLFVIVFAYLPMVGITIAFQDFNPTKGFFGSP